MKSFHPIFSYKPTTIFKAFVLNSIVTAFITVCSITIKQIIETHKLTKNKSETFKILIHAITTLLLTFFIYILFRFITGFGGGMLTSGKYKTFF